jgi:hypothetical protein
MVLLLQILEYREGLEIVICYPIPNSKRFYTEYWEAQDAEIN